MIAITRYHDPLRRSAYLFNSIRPSIIIHDPITVISLSTGGDDPSSGGFRLREINNSMLVTKMPQSWRKWRQFSMVHWSIWCGAIKTKVFHSLPRRETRKSLAFTCWSTVFPINWLEISFVLHCLPMPFIKLTYSINMRPWRFYGSPHSFS